MSWRIIHALTTSCGERWPCTIFSPAVLYETPYSCKTVENFEPLGLVCENDALVSSARLLAAAVKLELVLRADSPAFARSILTSLNTSSA